jgi:hypothetical protein
MRDSGLPHSLLAIPTFDHPAGHPGAGASWDGFVVEQIAAHVPTGVSLMFYRTAAGASALK